MLGGKEQQGQHQGTAIYNYGAACNKLQKLVANTTHTKTTLYLFCIHDNDVL